MVDNRHSTFPIPLLRAYRHARILEKVEERDIIIESSLQWTPSPPPIKEKSPTQFSTPPYRSFTQNASPIPPPMIIDEQIAVVIQKIIYEH